MSNEKIQVWMEALRLQLMQRGILLAPELHFLHIKGAWRWSVLARGYHESAGATPEEALNDFTKWLSGWSGETSDEFSVDNLRVRAVERYDIGVSSNTWGIFPGTST